MLRVEIEDGLFLLGQQPVVARNPGVVFMDRAVAPSGREKTSVEFACSYQAPSRVVITAQRLSALGGGNTQELSASP